MGNPRTITWYYNETATSAYTNQQGELTAALALPTGGETINKDGEYYAMIVNENGQTFISNTITLVYDELPAEIASMDIEDDYEGEGNIWYNAKDYLAVITVNMKKAYEGEFYVYEDSIVNYNSSNYAAMLDTTKTAFVFTNTANKMTAKNVLDGNFKGTGEDGKDAKNDDRALAYVAPNGETTLMWAVKDDGSTGKNYLTRGKSYKLAFDQAGLKTDDITGASRKDVEVTESVEAPYVETPAAIVLETAASEQQAVVNFVDENGDKLAWLGGDNNNNPEWDTNCGFESVTVFGNSEAKTDGAERAAIYGTIVKGVWTSAAGLSKDKTIYYAQAKTEAGVFAEKSETLQSDYKTKNLSIATKVKLTADGATAKITLTDVTAPAKVYVYNEGDARTAGEFDPDDSSSYRGFAEVSVGQGSAEVSSVFKKDEIGEHFFAVLVPNDEAAYARKKTTPNADNADTGDDQEMILKEDATSIEYLSGVNSTKLNDQGVDSYDGAGTAEVRFTNQFVSENLIVKNQFGEIVGTTTHNLDYLNKITKKAATVTVNNGGKTYTEKGGATFSYDGNALTIDLQSFSGVDQGDGFSVTLLGSTIKFEAQFEPTKNGQKPFTAKLGSDTLCTGGISAAQAAEGLANVTQINNALANDNITTVLVNATANTLSGSISVPKNKTLEIGASQTGLSISNSGTLKLTGATTLKGYTAPADSTSVVTGNNLTISDSLSIGSGATMTVADDLTLGAGAEVSHDGQLTVDGKLTTATAAQNIALSTEVDIDGVDGTADAPDTITAGASKTIVGQGSVLATWGTAANGATAAINNGAPIALYTFAWPEGQTTTSKWGVGYDAPATVDKAFDTADDAHFQLVGDTAAHTIHYAYDADGAGTGAAVYFNITYPKTKNV